MTAFLKEQAGEMAEYDDKLVQQLMERIEVHDDKMVVIFKSGISEKLTAGKMVKNSKGFNTYDKIKTKSCPKIIVNCPDM